MLVLYNHSSNCNTVLPVLCVYGALSFYSHSLIPAKFCNTVYGSYMHKVLCLSIIIPATETLFYLSMMPCLSLVIPATFCNTVLPVYGALSFYNHTSNCNTVLPFYSICICIIIPTTVYYKYTTTMLIVIQSTTETLKILLVLYSTHYNNVHIVINTENTTDYTQ